jgi:ParB-like chromosome segregation protein Spo0J
MQYVLELLPISKIHVGARRRGKLGSLVGLKTSLQRVGQIHPITVRLNGEVFELVAGERRLRAAEALGWKKIRTRVGIFSDDQLREIELDENTVRLDLTDLEASKARLRQIQAAEREAEDEARQDAAPDSRYQKRGSREASRRTGLSEREVRRTKKHVAAADEHPVFQRPAWKRSQVLAAQEALEVLPKRDHVVALEMVSEPYVDPKTAVTMLETLAEKPATERAVIVTLYRSGDPEQRSLAKTRAAKLPPLPDPRHSQTREMQRLVKNCIRLKADDLRGAYEFVADEIEKILGELDDAYEKRKGGTG